MSDTDRLERLEGKIDKLSTSLGELTTNTAVLSSQFGIVSELKGRVESLEKFAWRMAGGVTVVMAGLEFLHFALHH